MVNFSEGLIAFVFYEEVNVLYFICMEGTCMNHSCDKKYAQKEKLGCVIVTSSSLGVLKTKHLVCTLGNLLTRTPALFSPLLCSTSRVPEGYLLLYPLADVCCDFWDKISDKN